jgi:outer membrane protein TolC
LSSITEIQARCSSSAFGEVEDALSRQRTQELRYRAFSARLADDRRALLEAQDRYDRGEVGLLPVLEARQLLYATEEAEVASGLNRCLADISLYQALGGRLAVGCSSRGDRFR